MEKSDVIATLEEIAVLLELAGENPFKARAYHNAARVLEAQSEDVDELVYGGTLGELPGIGEILTKKITQLVTTGRMPYYDELRAKVPRGLIEMMRIPGLGPKRAKILHEKLRVDGIEGLKKACERGDVASLSGFGETSEQNILEGIAHVEQYGRRHLLSEAWPVADGLLKRLEGHPAVMRAAIAGSLRRRRETIGDIDLLASSANPRDVIRFFTTMPEIGAVVSEGDTKATVRLKSGGMQVDLRAVSVRAVLFHRRQGA